MPELPEVETVKRILTPQLIGRRIQKLTIHKPEIIATPDAESFAECLTNAVITGLRRRGKFLLIDFENHYTVTLHLRMTGQLFAAPKNYPCKKHTHLIFHLDDGNELRFVDVRRFGKFWLLRTEEPDILTGIQKLGLEPFDAELTGAYLEEKFSKRKIAVKQALLEQSVIAGIGNIYADEILYQSHIHPAIKTADLKQEQWESLAWAVPLVMKTAVRNNAITAEDYLKEEGRAYRTSEFLRVYGRKGIACSACGASIEKITISGRGSYYCPRCQSLK